jgi:hypothetical protein
MEAIFSSETSVDVQRTTRPCIPEDSTLQCNEYLTKNIRKYLTAQFPRFSIARQRAPKSWFALIFTDIKYVGDRSVFVFNGF